MSLIRLSKVISTPFKLTLIYFILGVMWILLSDAIINAYYLDISDIAYLQLTKGLLFISLTSLVLYLLVTHYHNTSYTLIEEIKNSEARYKQLFDRNPSPMWVFDKKTHRFLAVNDAATLTYGYSREDFLSMTIFDIRPDEDKENLLMHLQKDTDEYDLGESWKHVRKDGTIIDVEIFAQTVDFNGHEARLVQAIDVTQKKKYEAELIESETRYRIVTEKVPDAIYIRTEDEYLYMNQAGLDMVNVKSMEELRKYHPSKFYHSTFPYKKYEDLIMEMNSGNSLRSEEKLVSIGNKELDVEIIKTPLIYKGKASILGIARDITSKKMYENEILQKSFELKERNKELKCLYSLSQITSRNSSNLENDLSDIVKLIPPAFQFPEQTYARLKANNYVFESGPNVSGSASLKSNILVNNVIIGDITVCCSAKNDSSPFLDEEEIMVDAIAEHIGESIERKEALMQIRQLNEELEQRVEKRTNQLEAANKELESFSYTVSHDLRAPIRAIDGFTKILSAEYSSVLDEEAKRLIEKITNNTLRMDNLVDDLLSFSRLTKSSLEKELIDMDRIVNECFSEILDTYNNRIIELSIDKLPQVECDKKMIRQVWINLLSNAVKFSSKKEKSQIQIGWERTNGKIYYYIKDNGVGFNMDYKHKLFGIFQRLHSINEFEGTGIGLALCHKIISRHGGTIDVEAVPDKGAKFFFSLN